MYSLSQLQPESGVHHDLVSERNLRLAGLSTPQWYAVTTRSRHEKRVQQQLEERLVEVFLPLYESLHRWNDRTARVSLPLFPGYVFVRICLADRLQVATVPGVVRLVGCKGYPSAIPDPELAAVRDCWKRRIKMEPHPYLAVGRQVRIKEGPLAEMTGLLIRKKGRFRLVLSINSITRSVAVEVDAHNVEPIALRRQTA